MNKDYVRTMQLPNGFRIHVIIQPGYVRTSMALTVNFGSVDSTFKLDGKLVTQPAGIAHFLEHQLFDKDGYDVTEKFAALGADSNAFTSYTKTSYLASTVENPIEVVKTLVSFVTTPYFSTENVTKEKGIISQEIGMYADDPDNRLYVNTVENMYQETTLENDVAGSVESVNQITQNNLNLAYTSFYQPGNMNLLVVGNINVQQVYDAVLESFAARETVDSKIQKNRQNLTGKLAPQLKITAPVVFPKFALGLKGHDPVPEKLAGIKYEIAISIALDLFLSETASTYNQLYEANLLDDSFSYEFENEDGFHFAMLLGNALNPVETIDQLQKVIRSIPTELPKMQEQFELQKKELTGNYIEMMDSETAIVSQFGDFGDETDSVFDELNIITNLSFQDLISICIPFFKQAEISQTIIES
ncbi:pitrilysin family protein [Lentilactobacillus senioris]|uniref:EF-P 5-aminopentanol modification-associated protein YfmH n=1 Tax=Lentilactobacillus senioris TaxID=931534 RepID=UPI0022813769|nr:pitrilysin family protein [Lentilactobacillus senioris]MCY9807308.1 pitrilysin family protein [Lentilactobacillus senioris]